MLIPGVEPSLIAYKTIVQTDTLYELFNCYLFCDVGIEPTIPRQNSRCNTILLII